MTIYLKTAPRRLRKLGDPLATIWNRSVDHRSCRSATGVKALAPTWSEEGRQIVTGHNCYIAQSSPYAIHTWSLENPVVSIKKLKYKELFSRQLTNLEGMAWNVLLAPE